ncbi:MAG: hypothetical protein KDJ62_14650 [Rhodobiaceae bacterium]|nr:hypothetical protein [Rhodobiaceae bacterium]MCC0047647.1 hypothetical protein [Rhodobiaceae bacterium]
MEPRNCVFACLISVTLTACNYAEPQGGFVRREWSKSISNLSIVPTYPPNEDIQVGDLYAIEYDPKLSLEQVRSAKIGYSENALSYAEKYYKSRIMFADKNGKGAGRRTLVNDPPEMALPGYTIARGYVAQFAGSLPAQAFGLIFGTNHISNNILEVRVTSANTYNIPVPNALQYLKNFCTTHNCNSKTLAGIINATTVVPFNFNDPGGDHVKCATPMIVNQIFMTREIHYVYSVSRANATRIAAAAASESASSYVEALQKLAAVSIAVPPGETAEEQKAQNALLTRDAVMMAMLQNLNKDLSQISASQPSGAFTFASYADDKFTLIQKFNRPIVFGYNGVFLDRTHAIYCDGRRINPTDSNTGAIKSSPEKPAKPMYRPGNQSGAVIQSTPGNSNPAVLTR